MSYEDRRYRFIDAMLIPGSQADRQYRDGVASFKRSAPSGAAQVGRNDLFRKGGRTVPQALFRNVFLGGIELWTNADHSNIDNAIARALRDRRLENVMRQYFPGEIVSCERLERVLPPWTLKAEVGRADAKKILETLFENDPALARDLAVTVFNIVLPRSVVLRSGSATSHSGLGGLHGSMPILINNTNQLVYYSFNVFSEEQADGRRNGIPVFSPSWKNVVATLYHEINEFRTDPDVELANAATSEEEALALVGWISNANEEVGDNPLSGDNSISKVFDEILLTDEPRRVAVQFMYSNTVHGPQGPVDLPSDATLRKGHGVGLRGIEISAKEQERAIESRFGRLFPDLPPRGDVAPFPEDLGLPGGPMDGGIAHQNSDTLLAIMTYFGQFVDHDITFDPTSSLERQQDPTATRNFRTPALELDNVYGGGPAADPFLYDRARSGKMLLGSASNDPAEIDLPRNTQGVAILGDPRNDENLIISQLHVAFLKFHNVVVDQAPAIDDDFEDDSAFEKAQRLVRWHYQWLILKEFLPAIVGRKTLNDVLTEGRRLYQPEVPFIPVEFSVAAYRFGHSMVQPGYAINDTFGQLLFPGDPAAPPAVPGQRRQDLRGGPLRFDERVNWKNFLDTGVPVSPGPVATRFSSKIDTRLSAPLLNLPTSVVPAGIPAHFRSLAVRNLQRGISLGLPAGQAFAELVCNKLGINQILSDDELWGNPRTQQFKGSPAPLWYYLLREAEVRAKGEHLGPVGGRIVAEVLVGLLDMDRSSFRVAKPDWTPQVIGRRDPARFTFEDFFRIAGTDVD